eukprot:CAMPEP_0114678376 /NCGR_PEP_ID=MMETSP0191-20121206/51653_1 /TAXON_ID=126664 /ORGANISM="Sorites sp." /LENGTH=188 /DNA_ID=CAMNT_0001952271 /DNA_START=131 /DNA_END=694 /DNA_ORIENTATION=+
MKTSPFARDLFIVDGVSNVFLTNEYVSVTIDDSSKWADIQGEIVSKINEYIISGKAILEDNFDIYANEIEYDDDDEVVAIIRELIDTRIRPNVQYDGGDVIYRGFEHDTGIVKLELVGACKGCSSSSETLHNGIERMLQFYVPEVQGVLQVESDEAKRLEQINKDAFDAVQQKLSSKQSDDDSNNDSS